MRRLVACGLVLAVGSGWARAGQCVAAVMTATRLAGLDPELYRQLLDADQALAMCVATVRAGDP